MNIFDYFRGLTDRFFSTGIAQALVEKNTDYTTRFDTPKASIEPVGNHYGIFYRGELIQEYTRKYDALRGAERRGWLVA